MRPRTLSVVLSSEERQMIKGLRKTLTTEQGKKRCDIILAADEGTGKPKLTFLQISQALNVSNTTVITTIEDFCEGGITGALTVNRNPNSNIGSLKIDGRIEAQIIAKACSTPPEGYCRWTLSLLEKELALVLEEPVSKSSINRVLNGNEIRPHLNEYWCIPPKENGDFVAIMEDILDIYELPYNPSFPLWCVDEKPYQLLGEVDCCKCICPTLDANVFVPLYPRAGKHIPALSSLRSL